MENTIYRTEPSRGEWVFTAVKADGHVLGEYKDYDTALAAFKASERRDVRFQTSGFYSYLERKDWTHG